MAHRRNSLLTAGWLIFIAVPGLAAETETSKPFVSGGVLAPSSTAAYFPSTKGGTVALNLADGKVLWSAPDAPTPLAATLDKVFIEAPVKGKANQVTLKVFDAGKGKPLRESGAIAFPDWVSVPVAYGRSFRSVVRFERDSLVYIWEAEAFYAGGPQPTPEVEAAVRKSAQGAFRYTPETGKVEAVKNFKVKPAMFPVPPAQSTMRGLTFTSIETRDPKAKVPKLIRSIEAVGVNGKAVWRHEIAAIIVLEPLK